MRRVAAATLTAGTVIAAMAATATPAQAASSFTTTTSKGVFKNVKASGVFSRSSSKATVRFSLTDYQKDGYTACVQFRFEEQGKKSSPYMFSLVRIVNDDEIPLDGKATVKGGKVTDPNTQHAFVRECAVSMKTKKTYFSKAWKKLY